MLATSAYSHEEKVAFTWEHFSKMFCTDSMSLVERERLAQEYLSLRQMI